MITLEQKKQLQFDAGIPHLPTDLTYECRMAISDEGERAYEWRDKPHRLVYDLSRQVEADADRIEQLERERDRNAAIAIEAIRKATLADEWRDHDKTRAEAAEAKLAKAVAMFKAIEMWDAARGYPMPYRVRDPMRAVLAELEKQ